MTTIPTQDLYAVDSLIRLEVERHYEHFIADIGDLGFEVEVISKFDLRGEDVILKQGIHDLEILVARPFDADED